MDSNKDNINIEQLFHDDLHQYLLSIGMVDERLPEAQDIEELWQKIGESYLPDGMREFRDYPTVSLGWMMFVGMAIAKYWDTDWELYSKVDDLYKYLRDSATSTIWTNMSARRCFCWTRSNRRQWQRRWANVPHVRTTCSIIATLSQALPKPSAHTWLPSTRCI